MLSSKVPDSYSYPLHDSDGFCCPCLLLVLVIFLATSIGAVDVSFRKAKIPILQMRLIC